MEKLVCKNITFKYSEKSKREIVKNFSLSFNSGEIYLITGFSGCGKSTLGRCILRLIEPTDGEVIYQGENIVGCSKEKMKELRKELQIIFQDPMNPLIPG